MKTSTLEPANGLIQYDDAGPFTKGDLVNVRGRHGTYWRFLGRTVNPSNGLEWATVYGGTFSAKGQAENRHFHQFASVAVEQLAPTTLPKRIREALR